MVSSLFVVCKILIVAIAILGPEEGFSQRISLGKNGTIHFCDKSTCKWNIPISNTSGSAIIFHLAQQNKSGSKGFCFQFLSTGFVKETKKIYNVELCSLRSNSCFVYLNRLDECNLNALQLHVESHYPNCNITSLVVGDTHINRVPLTVVSNSGTSLQLSYESIVPCPRKRATKGITRSTFIVVTVLLVTMLLVAISVIIWMAQSLHNGPRKEDVIILNNVGGTGTERSVFTSSIQDIPLPPTPEHNRESFLLSVPTVSGLPKKRRVHSYEDVEIRQKEAQIPTQGTSMQPDKLTMADHSHLPAFMAHKIPDHDPFSEESDRQDEGPYNYLSRDVLNPEQIPKDEEVTTIPEAEEDCTDDMVTELAAKDDEMNDSVTQDTPSFEENPTKDHPIEKIRNNSENSAILVKLVSCEESFATINENQETQEGKKDLEDQIAYSSVEEDKEKQSEKAKKPLGGTMSKAPINFAPESSIGDSYVAVRKVSMNETL